MDDAEVLRFRPRADDEWARSGIDPDAVLGAGPEGEWGRTDRWDEEPFRGDRYGAARASRMLTEVVVIGDRVLDVRRRPVEGSGYECAVLELEDERRALAAPPPPEAPSHERQLAWLAHIVGSTEALAQLDTAPLQHQELCLDGVSPELHERMRGIDGRLQEWAPALLGPEGLAATRALLSRAVGQEPSVLTRSDRDDIATGAVLWAVAKGNDLVGSNRPLRGAVLRQVCGLRSSPSGRGYAFAHAASGGAAGSGSPYGFRFLSGLYERDPDVVPLGHPEMLLSRFRRHLVRTRDLALQLRERTPGRG